MYTYADFYYIHSLLNFVFYITHIFRLVLMQLLFPLLINLIT